MSDDFELMADNFFQVFGGGQPESGGIYKWEFPSIQPVTLSLDFTLSAETVAYINGVIWQVSESFRKIIEAIQAAFAEIFESLKALGFFDIDWDAINNTIEKAERDHARRFEMYQRRYERGKRP